MDANRGESNSVRQHACRPLAVLFAIAVATWVASASGETVPVLRQPKLAELSFAEPAATGKGLTRSSVPAHEGDSPDINSPTVVSPSGFFESAPAGVERTMSGMQGSSGAFGVLHLAQPQTMLTGYGGGLKQSLPVPQWSDADEAADPLLPDDPLMPDEVAPEPDVGYLLPHRGGLLGRGVRRVGPVRRWVHGLFNGRFAVVRAGGPLRREDWQFRPYSIGWFMGGVSGSPLLDDWVDQTSGYFAGYRIGWDYTCYWGCEMRLGFGYLELADSRRAVEAQQEADASIGLPPGDPFLDRFDEQRDSDLVLWDVSLLYYPWGNANWRPYFLAGLGAARVDFLDRLSVRRSETAFEVPLGVGVKHRCRDWLALRFDVTDNIIFAQEFNTVHDLSFTCGVEILFGGTRKAYWPWNPGRHYWW